MTPRDFVYWLQGYFEIAEAARHSEKPAAPVVLNTDQVFIVRRHLAMVMAHINPPVKPKNLALDAMMSNPQPTKPDEIVVRC